ncbi:MAG TPA: FAD-binding oxidoreductase [Candidatus Bathyarchaeia archaeon]|nr:FAD-binding oxidoreductase [Candidatus Bathyarchaeia archaeon]
MITNRPGRFMVTVARNARLSPSCRLLVLRRPAGFPDAFPGQFVSIRVSDGPVPLLRRPYSILDLTPAGLSLLIKVVGRGSAAIASAAPGQALDCIGPLGGAGFPEPDGNAAVFVAGGTGLAPLLHAVRAWRRKRLGVATHLLYGAETRSELFRGLVARDFSVCRFATIDGSSGYHGDVVGLYFDLVKKRRIPAGPLYSCGPRGMVRALTERGAAAGEHYTSLESIMACGVGACRGCTVPLGEPGRTVLRTVCSDGTVFRADDIAWEEWEE